jgi:hypothetical protein
MPDEMVSARPPGRVMDFHAPRKRGILSDSDW